MKTYPDWCYRQSAVVPFRQNCAGIEVLLITSRNGRKWIVPKGVVEPHLTPTESAIAEAFEEAGVRGTISEFLLGTYRYSKWGGTCAVNVYPLRVEEELDDWPEISFRARLWLPLAKAAERVASDSLAEIIRILGRHVDDTPQPTEKYKQL